MNPKMDHGEMFASVAVPHRFLIRGCRHVSQLIRSDFQVHAFR
jgi:hypothetical protein